MVALLGDEERYFLPSGSEVKQSDTGSSCTAIAQRLSLPCHWTQLQPGTPGLALSQLAGPTGRRQTTPRHYRHRDPSLNCQSLA